MNDEISKYRQELTEIGVELDSTKLPNKINKILYHFLGQLCDNVPLESLLVSLNVKLAHMVSSSRIKVQTLEGNLVPINYYGVTFMRSGKGKDKPLRYIDNYLFKDFREKFEKIADRYMLDKQKQIAEIAEEKFAKSPASKERYIEEHSPRALKFDFGDGTVEGLLADRKAFMDAQIGATFLHISEFGDYILSDNNARSELLSLIWDIYDTGDSKAKTIKSDKVTQSVTGVPSNVLFHTSLSGLQTDRGRQMLLNIFNRALARRCFVCYPEVPDYVPPTCSIEEYAEKYMKQTEEALNLAPAIAKSLAKSFQVGSKKYSAVELAIKLSPEARKTLTAYRIINRMRADRYIASMDDEGFASEIETRDWKTLKLAGLIALIEHPDSLEISDQDMRQAIYQSEFFGLHLKKFYTSKAVSDADRLLAYFKNNLGTWVSKGDIRGLGLVHKDRFANWFKDTMDEMRALASQEYYKVELQGSGHLVKYRVIKEEQKS